MFLFWQTRREESDLCQGLLERVRFSSASAHVVHMVMISAPRYFSAVLTETNVGPHGVIWHWLVPDGFLHSVGSHSDGR